MSKYYFHHVRKTNGAYDKQIDIFNTLEEAEQQCRFFLGSWGYGHKVDTPFVSAMVTNENGAVVNDLSETWYNDPNAPIEPVFFMHRIKHDSADDSTVKGIEVHTTYDNAKQSFNAYLGSFAYGVSTADYVSCMITDNNGVIMKPYSVTWKLSTPELEA